MADPRNAAGHARGLRGPVVNSGRLHQRGAKRFGHAVNGGGEVRLRNLDDFPDERKPVGVDAGRRQRDCHVARRRHVARKQGAAFGGTDRKTRKVESAIRIDARHFGRFTANKRGLAFDAPVGDAGDHFARQRTVQSAGGKIVQKEQGGCALSDDVVDAHGHEVDPETPIASHGPRQFKLGADTVRGRDKDRVRKAGGLDIEQATESAERAVGTGPPCPFRVGGDVSDKRVSGVNIHPGIAVAERVWDRSFFRHAGKPTAYWCKILECRHHTVSKPCV